MSTPDAPLPKRKSLRARGLLATLLMLLYLSLSAAYVTAERMSIDDSVGALESLSQHEKALAAAEAAVSGALLDVTEISNGAHAAQSPPAELRLYMESCAKLFEALEPFDPRYAKLQRAIARSYDDLQAQPARSSWIDMRESLARAASELELRRAQLGEQRAALVTAYQRSYDAATVKTMLLSIVGLMTFGTLTAWFFSNLSRDIGRLEVHARSIVAGSRGVALRVNREDEVGRLMHAVNRMAVDLDEREQRIELESQRRSHHDKLLAMGAVAAGMAHEVNNPLAIIAASAQALESAARERGDAAAAEDAALITVQAYRAGHAAQRLAEAASPPPAQRDWFDLSTLVRHVVQWMAFDRRYRGYVFDVRSGADLPAVFSSAEAVQRVLTQLLTLAGDALAAQGQSHAIVTLTLSNGASTIDLALVFPARLDLAQEETQRTLALLRAVLEPLEVALALAQDASGSSIVKLTFPMNADQAPQ